MHTRPEPPLSQADGKRPIERKIEKRTQAEAYGTDEAATEERRNHLPEGKADGKGVTTNQGGSRRDRGNSKCRQRLSPTARQPGGARPPGGRGEEDNPSHRARANYRRRNYTIHDNEEGERGGLRRALCMRTRSRLPPWVENEAASEIRGGRGRTIMLYPNAVKLAHGLPMA